MYIILFTPIIADNRYSDVNRINFSFEEMNINNNLNNSFNNINNKKTKTIKKEKIFLEYTHEMSDGTDKLNRIWQYILYFKKNKINFCFNRNIEPCFY